MFPADALVIDNAVISLKEVSSPGSLLAEGASDGFRMAFRLVREPVSAILDNVPYDLGSRAAGRQAMFKESAEMMIFRP